MYLACLGCEHSVVGSSDLGMLLVLFDMPVALLVSRISVVVLDRCVVSSASCSSSPSTNA